MALGTKSFPLAEGDVVKVTRNVTPYIPTGTIAVVSSCSVEEESVFLEGHDEIRVPLDAVELVAYRR